MKKKKKKKKKKAKRKPSARRSNTPPQNSIPNTWNAGIDYVSVSYDLEFREAWQHHKTHIEDAKECACDPDMKHNGLATVRVGDKVLRLSPVGRLFGDRVKGVVYDYDLEWRGLHVYLRETGCSNGKRGKAIVQVSGTPCLRFGYKECLNAGREILNTFGCNIVKERLNRIDIRLDMPGVSIMPFFQASRDERYVKRAKSRHEHETAGAKTLEFGNKSCVLKIYDKLREVKSRRDPQLMSDVQERCWNGKMPDKAIRVELKLQRECLKGKGIDSPDDFITKCPALVQYLCTKWFRFTATSVKRSNTTRMKIMPLWQDVIDAFTNWAGDPTGIELEPLPSVPVDSTVRLKTAYGHIRRVAEQEEADLVSFDEFCDIIMNSCLLKNEQPLAVHKVLQSAWCAYMESS